MRVTESQAKALGVGDGGSALEREMAVQLKSSRLRVRGYVREYTFDMRVEVCQPCAGAGRTLGKVRARLVRCRKCRGTGERRVGRGWRFDFAWPVQRIALEIDGGTWVAGRHNRGGGSKSDAEKFSRAAVLGWRVLRATREHVKSGEALQWVEQALNGPPPHR